MSWKSVPNWNDLKVNPVDGIPVSDIMSSTYGTVRCIFEIKSDDDFEMGDTYRWKPGDGIIRFDGRPLPAIKERPSLTDVESLRRRRLLAELIAEFNHGA